MIAPLRLRLEPVTQQKRILEEAMSNIHAPEAL